ncbi:RsmB/NOP family class I SAM-dependent RNA methyltransferase [Pontibacter sp. G13]|uniref:RsmB/NOP family class I SAM-dependent RNA methyltransferase n=1 Tax=Pontibacter sp. G13 TaxID=3074898 RepID=UPI00288A1067|nr:RsmB/NOP family class I SAM-dependent RNA methyltransferase [Pontibacter sp. G13]WNJ19653.1 RsmB/NOP family class I SAM-dependent RNA methyltransferase [Pontibacter sp. G13]
MSQTAFPEAFLARMRSQLGDAFDAFWEAIQGSAHTSIRLNPGKPISEDPTWMPMLWHPEGRYLATRPPFVEDPRFHAGAYYVQEASSMMLHACVDWSRDMRILDLCAAPGGKSTLIAAAMSKDSVLVANEVISSRAKVLAENLTRWGRGEVVVTQNDPADFQDAEGMFDLIVVDAPCSGEGMFRKDPASRGEWSPQHVEVCSARQRRILANILPCLRPGGTLVYSTCTWAPEEDQEIVDWVLDEFRNELELDPVEVPNDWGPEPIEVGGVQGAGWLNYPHRVQGEGLFFARFRKQGVFDTDARTSSKARKKKKKQKSQSSQSSGESADPKVLKAFETQYLKPDHGLSMEALDKYLFARPALARDLKRLGLKVIKQGVLLGEIHRKEIAPSHELALSTFISTDVPAVELDLRQAQQYLQKQEIAIDAPVSKGWFLVRYEGINLGWMKVAGRRLNNYFPSNWRIRKRLEN